MEEEEEAEFEAKLIARDLAKQQEKQKKRLEEEEKERKKDNEEMLTLKQERAAIKKQLKALELAIAQQESIVEKNQYIHTHKNH